MLAHDTDRIDSHLDIHPDVQEALANRQPVVALETTIITHGLPWPVNLECARALEETVRRVGAVPATIGICGGRVKIGLTASELQRFATAKAIAKVSRRDLAAVIAQGHDGATTVAATMFCAASVGIQLFATGGIGGVHRGVATTMDISADLVELGRTPVAVVCAGAKSVLDIPKTLEVLETWGVPVLGFGTNQFPAFYLRSSGLPVASRVDSAAAVAHIIRVQRQLNLSGGIVIAVPIPETHALDPTEVENWTAMALSEAKAAGIIGKALTPFLLARIADLSQGRTLQANLALANNTAAIAADIAKALIELEK